MLVLIISALIYICLPWYIQLAAWIVNLFIPDPVPILDELLMLVPVFIKIKRIVILSEFLRKFGKILAIVLGVGLVVLILCFIFF